MKKYSIILLVCSWSFITNHLIAQEDVMALQELDQLVDWSLGMSPARGVVDSAIRSSNLSGEMNSAVILQQEAATTKQTAITSFQTDSQEKGNKSINKAMAENTANKLEEAITRATQQADIFFKKSESIRTHDVSQAIAYAHIAQVYQNTAEQTSLAESIWRAMAKKKSIKTSAFLNTIHASQTAELKAQAKAALENTVRLAESNPSVRSAELFKNADLAAVDAQEAWNNRFRTEQEHQSSAEALRTAEELLSAEQVEFAQKESVKHKTFWGMIAKGASQASSVLDNVSVLGVSPATVTQGIAVAANIINNRAIKYNLKIAKKNFSAANQLANTASQAAQVAELTAPEADNIAKAEETYARDYYAQVAKYAASISSSSTWERRVQASEKYLNILRDNGNDQINKLQADFNTTAEQAQLARSLANEAEQKLNNATTRLQQANDALRQWITGGQAQAINNLNMVNMEPKLRQEVTDATISYNECFELNNSTNSAKGVALSELANSAEQRALRELQNYQTQKELILKNIDRATYRLAADQAAWMMFHPQDASKVLETFNNLSIKEQTPSSSEALSPTDITANFSDKQPSSNDQNISSLHQEDETLNYLNQIFAQNKEEASLILALQQGRQELEQVIAKICNYKPDQGIITINNSELSNITKALRDNHKLASLGRVISQSEEEKKRILATLGIAINQNNLGVEEAMPGLTVPETFDKLTLLEKPLDKITKLIADLNILKKSEDKADITLAALIAKDQKLKEIREKEKAKKSDELRKSLLKELQTIKQQIEDLCQEEE